MAKNQILSYNFQAPYGSVTPAGAPSNVMTTQQYLQQIQHQQATGSPAPVPAPPRKFFEVLLEKVHILLN